MNIEGDFMKQASFAKALIILGAIISLGALLVSMYFVSTLVFNDSTFDPTDEKPSDPYKTVRDELMSQSQKLVKKHYIDEALEVLSNRPELSNKELEGLIQEIKEIQKTYVKYQGRIEHIFFHSLIVDTDKAFGPTSSDPKGYDLWMITVNEFKEILRQLKDRGYILVSLSDVYEKVNETWVEKALYLPNGKKPLLVSVDNIGYTPSRIKDGFASKLILTEERKLISEVTLSNQSIIQSDEGDVFPILESFIQEHPQFSFQDARAMLGVTGNLGILGYDPKKTNEKEEVIQVVNRMKELGWEFVNHSYTHAAGDYFSEQSKLESIEEDFQLFHAMMNPIIGKSNVFIAPFGIRLKEPMFSYIQELGYDVYATVDRRSQPVIQNGSLILPRVNIDGFVMRNDAQYISEHFFNVNEVFDKRRTP